MQKNKQEYQPFEDLDWKNRSILGQGAFGKVYKVKKYTAQEYVAIKEIDITTFKPIDLELLQNQINIQKNAKNKHIVQLERYKINQQKAYLLLELCGQDLSIILSKQKNSLSQNQSIQVLNHVVQAFRVLIAKNYIHRDVKPANILIKGQTYKISDFGFASKADMNYMKKMQNFCGTPIYMAPQILFKKPYTAKCDIWSIGLMFYQMIFGYPPWPTRNLNSYVQGIKRRKVWFPFNKKIGKNSKDFIQKCLVIEQQKRMTWQQMFNHPLVCKYQKGDETKIIDIENQTRISLETAQNQVKLKNIQLPQIFEKYAKFKILNFQQFLSLIKELSPSITSQGVRNIFQFADKDKSGTINYEQFSELFQKVDFRKAEDFKSRIFQQIAAMIKFRNLTIDQLFNQIDMNQSGSLQWEEFDKFLTLLSKDLKTVEKLKFFNIFDDDKSSCISNKQFKKALKQYIPSSQEQNHKEFISSQRRATSNLVTFKQHLKSKKITPSQFIKRWDKDKDARISYTEFLTAVEQMEYIITHEQIKELFQKLDSNDSDSISVSQLLEFIK